MGKIGQIQQLAQPHEEIVNTACEELQRMRNLSGFRRWLNAFRIRRISACLQTSGLSYLRCRLEISACTIAVQQLLDKLIDFVDDRLAELSLMRQNLRQVHASSRQLADHEAARPTVSSMMLGPDLVDEEYLRDFFDGGVAAHDGPENFVHDLTARFLSQYGSLSCLAGKPPDEIEQILGRLCREAFEPRLEQRDVMTELQRCYPNESKQRQLFQQAVRQSEGRVRTVGENDEEVVWTKFGTAPNNDYAERIQSIVAKVDDKPGQWHMLIDGNHDAVSVIQIRTNISLQSIIDGLELPDDSDTWEQIIELAVDPFTAITEPPNPNDRQIRRAFAKAIITEQLVYDTARGFELRFNGQEPVQLDKDAKEAGRALARWWPYVVRIGTTFGHHIVVDDGDVAVRIEQLSSLSREDPRSALIDTRAIEEVKRQFDLLIDRARRLRTAVKKD
jgi:hypothetical protein